ncbi:UPF0042 nucleotide-binding protein [Salinihabitans flavidus]|uniref:UPF0042 nucleotide-binding protein n=1 Tax=Salinihabitans flavidus TaxID=569882 RepID=A0A1H8T8Q6_9RHOB|nr:RNase adapter RapZ [Salinihabitans flavidus]SEO86934.1 UPF0042 nucleotide-binding protein [Salinihabitans flavidus]
MSDDTGPEITADTQRLVLVTGPSGAGRLTAIKALEDVGYEAIDNLPLGLVERLFTGPVRARPMALGLDVRNRDFSAHALLSLLATLEKHPGIEPELLYLDCSPEVLLRRYSETRRRHPMAPEDSPEEGIAREIRLLEDVRFRADVLIDTTELTPHGLRDRIEHWFAPKGGRHLALSLVSFSYKRGLPPGLDMVFDCRFLRNPHWEPALRALTGVNRQVADHVATDPRFDPFFKRVMGLVNLLLPAYLEEGKAHFSIGFGCTGGRHRSVFLTERVAEALAEGGWQVSVRHREMDRREDTPGPEVVAPGDARLDDGDRHR